MKLDDTLFNWLQIRVVQDLRPDDTAAKETADFFRQVLLEDHAVTLLDYTRNEDVYVLQYETEDQNKQFTFARELVEKLYEDICSVSE